MLRVVVITAVLVSACASPTMNAVNRAGHLEAGAATAPPEGLAEYCERVPEDCGAGAGAGLRGRFSPTGAAGFQRANSGRGDASLFHALLAQRQAAARDAAASDGAASMNAPDPRASLRQARVALDAARLQELSRINRQINRAIRPTRDLVLYGREEYWVRPLALGQSARGDCEDYALEKRAALIAAGWSVEALSLAVAVSPRVGLHAVLVVSTDQGDLVLDNLYDRPQPIAHLDYVWLSRQTGADLASWTSVRLVNGAPGMASPTDRFHAMMRERMGAQAPLVADAREELDESAPNAVAPTPAPAPAPEPEASNEDRKPRQVWIKPTPRVRETKL